MLFTIAASVVQIQPPREYTICFLCIHSRRYLSGWSGCKDSFLLNRYFVTGDEPE